MDNSNRVPQLVGGDSGTLQGNHAGHRDNDSALTPKKAQPTEGEQQGRSVIGFQEPQKPPDDDDDGDHLHLRVPRDGEDGTNHGQNNGSLDMDCHSSFMIDDDRNSPPYRRDRAGYGSLSGDEGSGSFSPQPFEAPGEELNVDSGMHTQQLLSPRSYGDRCSTRGNQQERVDRAAGFGGVKPRARRQVIFQRAS